MSEVGHNDIDFPPNQLLNCSCNTLRLIGDMALSRPMTAAPMFLCMSTTSRPPAWRYW